MARISDDERVRRLHEIDKLNQEGRTDYEIADTLGMSINAVKRLQRYLDGLMQADLTPEVLAEKRTELFLELSEATIEAKTLFDRFKNPRVCKYCSGEGYIKKKVKKVEVSIICEKCKGYGEIQNTKDAERFLRAWVDVIEKKAKLYGLDNVKTEVNFNQFNDNRQYVPEIKLTGKAKRASERLSDILKKEHENRVRKTHGD